MARHKGLSFYKKKKKITENPESALKLAEEKLDKKERNTF